MSNSINIVSYLSRYKFSNFLLLLYILVYVLSQSSNPFCVSARICLNANISDIFQLKNSCSSNHSFLSLANGYEGEGQFLAKICLQSRLLISPYSLPKVDTDTGLL
jgi:hypothetical protein